MDYKSGGQGQYSFGPHYAIRANYLSMINKMNAKPLLIPYDYEMIEYYLDLIDGLMIIGGAFDIHPKRYGETEIHPQTTLNEIRENFEFEIVTKALKQNNLPIFGICNGMQLLGVIHGSKVIQHIRDFPEYLEHEQSRIENYSDYHKPYHEVVIAKNSKLFAILGEEKIFTNSSHHQAIKDVKCEMKITGKTEDGIIEAIELEAHPFCLGVQWHPEFGSTNADNKLFDAFAKACKNFKENDRK